MAEVTGVTSHVVTVDEYGNETAQFVGTAVHVWLGAKFDGTDESALFISFDIAPDGGATRRGMNHGEADLEEGDLFAILAETIAIIEPRG